MSNSIYDTVREQFAEKNIVIPHPVDEPLTAQDRCDVGNCGAGALVRVVFAAGELLFCGHHYDLHKVKIASTTGAIHDSR